ncbi:hypothetical protein [Ralstonia phage phiRSL1]|uniref:Uncharacterized protein n=1 Tax=Ralstonia phage phiRSL1 TaxID=1980924 RepID=B2ZXT7_9CAUD|nr:hypothetical protein RSL1_ORF067 [Ralstonia phage phiRSL1]BAG41513.1 hypothetical protein [Ralstonia phage phiRSL1]
MHLVMTIEELEALVPTPSIAWDIAGIDPYKRSQVPDTQEFNIDLRTLYMHGIARMAIVPLVVEGADTLAYTLQDRS